MARTSGKKITTLLHRGLSVAAVASRLKCTRRWVYDYAKRNELPRNIPIRPGSSLERQISFALLQYRNNTALVGRLYSQAESNIKLMVARLLREGRAHSRSSRS